MRKSLRALLYLLVLIASSSLAPAQRLTLFGVDTTGYPEMSAELSILDANGIPISGYQSSDFTVTENGDTVDAVAVTCPKPVAARQVSFALVTDKSGSMLGQTAPNQTRFDILRAGLKAFVSTVQFTGQTSVAITAFDGAADIVADFQHSSPPLLDAIDRMQLGGLTNYDAALRDPVAGGIPLLRTRPDSIARVLIFLTDGTADLGGYLAVINEAKAAHITIYVITIGMVVPNVLQEVATETGGMAFGYVNDEDQLTALYTQIAVRAQSNEPCRLNWRSHRGCGYNSRFRDLKVTLRPLSLTGHTSYTAPEGSIYGLATEPLMLLFGAVAPSDSSVLPLKITATTADVRIDPVLPPGTPFTVVDWGGTAPPFTLARGESRTLKVRFAPSDSSISSTTLQLSSDPCPFEPVILTGGTRESTGRPALRLITPVGGESYSECDSVVIRWEGNTALEKVRLEYSSNNGLTWRTIADSAPGSIYIWAPPGPGSSYRVKVSLRESHRDNIATIAGGGNMDVDNIPATASFLYSPIGVATLGNQLYFSEEGAHRVRRVDLATGIITTFAGTGQSGGRDGVPATIAQLYNPDGMTISGTDLFIADYSNHLVRRVDMTTGIMTTMAGTGQSGYSGDGGPGKLARIYFPSDVAVSGNTLFIADRENGRVRAVDRTTGIIRTVAGGGDIPVADGGLATKSLLLSPTALAVDGDSLYIAEEGAHRVRRVDLRTSIMYTVAGDGTQGASADGLRADSSQLGGPDGLAVIGNYLVISEKANHRIRIVDRRTRRIRTLAGAGLPGFAGDGGAPLDARLNKPARLVANENQLFIADPLNNRVRVLTLGNAGRADSSSRSFTVSSAQLSIGLAGKRADLGVMAVGSERDSVIAGTICNRGTVPLHADSVRVTGADSADFQLISGLTSTPIIPGECRPVEIRFRPEAVGARTAAMIFYGRCGGLDTLQLSGTGATACGVRVLGLADLGSAIAGAPRGDTILQSSLCNTGLTTLEGEITLRQTGSAFTLVSGGGHYSLAPGYCQNITVRFSPALPGRVTAEVDYGIPATCGVQRTRLYARGLRTQELVADSSMELRPILCPSDVRDTFLLLRNFGETPRGITGITLAPGTTAFSILSTIPSGAAPIVIPPEGVDTVRIRFAPTTIGTAGTTITITSDGTTGTLSVAVTGRKDSLRLAPDVSLVSVSGALAAASYPLDTTITLRNTGTVPVTITGGAITGADRTMFDLTAGQLPITIPPGGKATVHLLVLASSGRLSYRAALNLTISPACDSAIIVDLIETGTEPALLATPPVFRDLICANDTTADTTLLLRNPGGSELRITGYTIDGPDSASFSFSASLPIVIPPGGSISLPIRFAPATPGAKSARLVLVANTTTGDSVVSLAGQRETEAYAASPGVVAIGPVKPGVDGTGSFILRNDGTRPTTLTIDRRSGGLGEGAPASVTLEPGEERAIVLTINRGSEGIYRDTLTITDDICGITKKVGIEANIADPAQAIVSLPTDSAGRGTRVSLPIRIAIPDRPAFAARSVSRYTTTITFSGIVLYYDTTLGARALSAVYDGTTGLQTVTIEGEYGGSGDTLAILGCETLSSDSARTGLHFTSFAWEKPGVTTQMLDGLFSVTEDCGPGIRLAIRPRVLKIRPMPIGGDALAEIELDEATQLRATLIDGMGREVALLADHGFPAGSSTLPIHAGTLPSGLYTLRLSTPFGESSVKVMVAH